MRYSLDDALEDQKDLLNVFRDRERELGRAVTASTWVSMRAQPGVTNRVAFESRSSELMGFLLSDERIEQSVILFAAEAEARRRLLITAIALERYRVRHGAYPGTLALLTPEILTAVPLDFMDGQPLRYRLTGDGHFLLYSVGLDGVDDGGKMPSPDSSRLLRDQGGFPMAPTNVDIVWPPPESGTN
jgi:hypothetical protein